MGFLDMIFGSPEKRREDLKEKLAQVVSINKSSKAELETLRNQLTKLSEDKVEERNNIQQLILEHEEAIRRSDKDIEYLKRKLTKLNPAMQPA
jgi:predicted  nucleic acid-binding Zn-ribbon protein